mmetsp:Transcript_27980/g.61945  ORF Transcript_27980/g.61945 Transcript_27980/m.61945 type:complete len:234 (+) Transcript_27980:1034-1735(+)
MLGRSLTTCLIRAALVGLLPAPLLGRVTPLPHEYQHTPVRHGRLASSRHVHATAKDAYNFHQKALVVPGWEEVQRAHHRVPERQQAPQLHLELRAEQTGELRVFVDHVLLRLVLFPLRAFEQLHLHKGEVQVEAQDLPISAGLVLQPQLLQDGLVRLDGQLHFPMVVQLLHHQPLLVHLLILVPGRHRKSVLQLQKDPLRHCRGGHDRGWGWKLVRWTDKSDSDLRALLSPQQ